MFGVLNEPLDYKCLENLNFYYLLSLVDDRHKLKVFNLNSIAMDSVQVGKAVFVRVYFASLDFEPRTFSYPESCTTNTLLAKKLRVAICHYIQVG